MEKLRILYIEDEQEHRGFLADSLRSKGFAVTVAASGKTGLGFFKKRSFDAILCDLNMPHMNGLQVLEKVRAKDKKIPFLILTAHGTVSLAVQAIKEGASNFILKPAEINEIVVAITQALEKSSLEEMLRDSQAVLNMVMENVPDVIYSLNPKGEFISLSQSAEAALGYKSSELLGKSVFGLIYPDDRKRVLSSFAKSIEMKDSNTKMLQFRMTSKSGEIRYFEISRRLLFENGQAVRSDGIARDVTERIMLENKLKEYSTRLEEKVKERTKSLKYANRQLAALNKVSNIFTRIYDEDKLYKETSRMLTRALDFDRAYLLLEKDGQLRVQSWCCRQEDSKQIEKIIKRINNGTADLPPHFKESFKQKKTVYVCDLKADRRWPRKPAVMARAKSMVIAPIKVKTQVVGLIAGFMDKPDRYIDKQDVDRFVMFASIVGLALDNIRTYHSLEQKVIERTDSLKQANVQLQAKTREIEKSQVELAKANVELLGVQEELEAKNREMETLLTKLSVNKDQLQAILDSTPSVMIMVNKQGKIVAANRGVKALFGLDPENIIQKDIIKIQAKIKKRFEDQSEFEKLTRLLHEKPDTDYAKMMDPHMLFRRALKTGEKDPRYISAFTIPIQNSSGEELGRLWIYLDITANKQADEQLHTIIEASPVPLIITRMSDGEILFANEPLGKLVGTTPDKLVGRKSPDFYHNPEDRKTVIERLQKYGYLKDFEVRLKRLDGTAFWSVFSLIASRIGGESAIIGGIYDIDERRKMEDALRWERNFVSAVLDTAGALVIVLNREGNIVSFNKASQDITGFSFDEVKDKYVWDIFVLPEEKSEVKDVFKSLQAGNFPGSHENYFLTKDGAKRLIAWSNTALTDENGNVEFIIATGIDITDRKKAEENLKLYKEIFMNSTDGIMILDPDGKVIERNPAQRYLSGISDDKLIGKGIELFLGDELSKKVHNTITAKGSYRGELEFVRENGTSKSIDISIFSLKGDQDELLYHIGMGRDITERKRAQRALEIRLRYEEALAQCSRTLLSGSEREDALTEVLGYLLKAAATGRVYIFENFEDEKDGLCMRQIHEVCAEGVEPQIDNPILQHAPYKEGFDDWKDRLASGESINGLVESFPEPQRQILEPQGILSMLVIPIIVGNVWFGFIGFDDVKEKRLWSAEDIRALQTASEIIGTYIRRKQIEEALRVSEERFRSLVENANDIIFSASSDANFTYISPTASEILEYDVSEIIGKPFYYYMHPDDRKEAIKVWEKGLMKTRSRWSDHRFRLRHKDGNYRWFISNSSVIFNEDGEFIELVGVAHDITEIQNLLEELEKANRELKATQLQLVQSEKMASLGMLVAGIAHEINTPIGAASSMHNTSVRAIQRLKKHFFEKFKSEIEGDTVIQNTFNIIDEANKVIESGAGRVTEIVKRLRSFARLDEAELQNVDIHEGIEDTLTLIHHEIKHGITVEKKYGDLPAIACFPGQLNQVFLNLFINASQAIKGKGKIVITSYRKGNSVFIEIADTGVGIRRENIGKIFDPGFTTKGVGVGTGLGLSICYQIIQNHHGKISVDSKVGEGTTFTIQLPTNLEELINKGSK